MLKLSIFYIIYFTLYFINVCLYFLSENYKLSEVLKPMSVLLDHIKSRWGNFS